MHDKETPQGLPKHNLADENLSLPVDDLSKRTAKGEGCNAEIAGKLACWRSWKMRMKIVHLDFLLERI